MRVFRCLFVWLKKNCVSILLLFLIPIVDTLFLFCFLAKSFNYQTGLLFLLQITSLISATTASVGATILFYKSHKDVEKIEMYRILIVVFSLSNHLIVELLLLRDDFDLITKYVITSLLLFCSIVLVVLVVNTYRSVDEYRKDRELNFNKLEANHIKNMNSENVGGNNYNVGD